MASRLILLPNKRHTAMGPDGKPVEVHTPDFLGVEVQGHTIKTDYRDVSKVMVTAAPKALDELHQKSREHFTRLWKQPQLDTGG